MKTTPGRGGAGAGIGIPLRVLIVEDSEDDAVLLVRELERGGYGPDYERVSSLEAMRRALAEAGPWDVILSDWRLPRFSATEALELLREVGSEAPFILVSQKIGEEAAVEAMRSGAHDCVTKGDLACLCAAVERGLREAQVRRERRRAEEERDRLFEFSPDLLCVAGLDGYLRRVNPAFEETLGYSGEELLAKPFIEFVHPDDRATTRSELESLSTGARTACFENRYLRKDGSAVWLEWKAAPAVQEDLIYATARDVTERKRAQDAVERLGRRNELILNSTGEGIYGLDRQGRTTFVNPAAMSITGFAPEELLGRRLHDLIHHSHADGTPYPDEECPVHAVLRDGDVHRVEHEVFWRKDGTPFPVEYVGTPIHEGGGITGAVVAFRDITERKAAEQAIRQSEQLYRTVIEQAVEYVSLVDVETKRFVASNPAFRETLGYTEDELKGMTLYDIVAHDRESIDRNARRVLETGRYFMGERKHRRKDGSLVDVEISASIVLHDGREVACIVGHDITERVEVFRLLEERITALAGISASLTVGQPMEATLDALADRVVRSTAAVACSVVLFNAETGVFRTAGSAGLPEGYTAGLQAVHQGGAPSFAVEVFRTRRPMLVHDIRRSDLENPLFAPIHQFLHAVPWDTICFVPLVYRGVALGSLNLYYPAEKEPDEEELVFLGAVADQSAVAVENARLFADAQGKAALEERQRLARELHDSVSQALYGIALGARTARTLLDRGESSGRVTEWLEYVLSLAEAGLAEMRALIFELRPESLATEGLVAALERHAAALRARHEIAVRATLGEEPDLPLEAKEALYRIAQEALHNTVKHSRASSAVLRLECDARGITLEVSDDGAGFDPDGDFSGHLGLRSMRERAARLGGTFRIESTPGEGTTIRVRIPPGT